MGDKTYIDSYNGDGSVPLFIAFAIEQYKKHKGISGAKAARLLDEAGIIHHLEDYYDVLHTQSAQWLMEEIDSMITSKQISNL